MAKRPHPPKIELSAKAQVVAKATFERKKLITENIPEDVSRAKAGAWLTIISPITEWAGLKGDALNFKRQLLRIQQEETLNRVAEAVQSKLSNAPTLHAVPRKILVPALEKASLEDASDDVMIERWASLLASAALDVKVQPRFVGILEELTGAQAECLERVAFNQWEQFNYPATSFEDSSIEFTEHNVQQQLARSLEHFVERQKLEQRKNLPDRIAEHIEQVILDTFNRPGVLLRACFLSFSGVSNAYEIYDIVRDTGVGADSDLSILESLGLIREVAITCNPVLEGFRTELSLHYWRLTELGVNFCKVCSASRVQALEDKNAKSNIAGSRIQPPLWRFF